MVPTACVANVSDGGLTLAIGAAGTAVPVTAMTCTLPGDPLRIIRDVDLRLKSSSRDRNELHKDRAGGAGLHASSGAARDRADRRAESLAAAGMKERRAGNQNAGNQERLIAGVGERDVEARRGADRDIAEIEGERRKRSERSAARSDDLERLGAVAGIVRQREMHAFRSRRPTGRT